MAWNTEGADTKSVSVSVDSRASGGSMGDQSDGRRWPGSSFGAAVSLVVLAKVLCHHYADGY